jgi:hypothetical protein
MQGSNIVSAIHNLKMAQEHFEDFIREFPTSQGSRLFATYVKKIDWIYFDFISHPQMTEAIREGVKKEIQSDVFAVPAITEKVALLNPEQREMIELTIDAMLSGEEVTFIDK